MLEAIFGCGFGLGNVLLIRYKNIAYILHSTAYFNVWLKNNLLTCAKPLSTLLSVIRIYIFLSLKLGSRGNCDSVITNTE